MLPSQGLFKIYSCPLFEKGHCTRPYCHFKHAKKDEDNHNKPAVYTPTPVKRPLTLLTLDIPTTSSKKPRLEYTPTNPAINDDSSDNYRPKIDGNIPSYKPSSINPTNKDDNSINHNEESELHVEGRNDFEENREKNSDKEKYEENGCSLDASKLDISSTRSEENSFQTLSQGKCAEREKLDNTIEKKVVKDTDDKSKEKKSHSSSRKHSHSDRNRHDKHKSSSSRHKDSRRDKSESHKKHSDSDKHRSSSSSRKEDSRSSSHRTSSHKSSRHKTSSSERDKSRKDHKSSSSKSKSHTNSRHSRSKSREKSSVSVDTQDVKLSSPTVVLESSDEEDIMEQCKMIFDEFTANQQEIRKPSLPIKRPMVEEPEEDKYDDNTRKRVAHENALKIGKPISQGAVRKPNHIKNAMQSIYERQEIVRKKQEEEAAAAVKEAEENLRQAQEKLKQTIEQPKLSPPIPRTYSQPSKTSKSITPVSNIIAIEAAKKKIELLKAQGINSTVATPIQTAAKGADRIAHKAKIPVDSRIAPPVLEASSTKISYVIRMQYYNIMVKQCLNIYPNCEDAWERAQTEELTVFKKCSTPNIYKSSALLTVNKLRKESIEAGNVNTDKNKIVSHDVILAGKMGQSNSLSIQNKKSYSSNSSDPFDKLSADKAYDMIHELILTEEQLKVNGFPRPGNKVGTAIVQPTYKKTKPPSEEERYCCRCSKVFNLSMYDEPAVDECNYHPKGTGYRRGYPENSHICCQQPAGSPGCSYANYHVTDYIDYSNLRGFVTTIDRGDDYVPTKKDIFALDCEMCYTTQGVELTRVTVVDINSKTIYNSLVKPQNKIIDYNTTYSGITEELLQNETRSLTDVQAILLSMFHSKTILIGHSLESDLKALKIIHHKIVDTSILFPHKMGPPKKRALKNLCIENLKIIIQESDKGHDSAEDAEVCIKLVKFYLRNRIK